MKNYKIYPLLIQPYLENAILHGLSEKEGKKRVFLTVKELGENLLIIIQDNGVGREAAMKIKNESI